MMDERRKCVVDFLSFIEICHAALTNALGLPAFNIVSASWTYGFNLDHAVLRFRGARQPDYAYGLVETSLKDLIHFFIVPEAYPRYVEWLNRVRTIVVSGQISGTISSSTIMHATKGAERCLVETSLNPKASEKSFEQFKHSMVAKAKRTAQKNINGESLVGEICTELVEMLGIKNGVDFFANLANLIIETEDADKKNKKKDVSSLTGLTLLINSMRKKLAKATAGKNINDQAQLVAAIAVATDDIAAQPFLDALNRFVIVLSDMSLRKGSAPSLEIDASQVLVRASALLHVIVERLESNKGGAKDYIIGIIGAMIKVLTGPAPKAEQIAKTLKRLELMAFDSKGKNQRQVMKMMGGKRVVMHGMHGMHGGDNQQQQQQQQSPPPQPYPPQPYPPYPYPPPGPAPVGTADNPYVVREQADPYMKTMAGLSVGAQCCSCCAMWDLAEAVSD